MVAMLLYVINQNIDRTTCTCMHMGHKALCLYTLSTKHITDVLLTHSTNYIVCLFRNKTWISYNNQHEKTHNYTYKYIDVKYIQL